MVIWCDALCLGNCEYNMCILTQTHKAKAKPLGTIQNIANTIQRTSTGMPMHHLGRSHGERPRNLKFHNDPNTAKRDKDSWAFASPVNTKCDTYKVVRVIAIILVSCRDNQLLTYDDHMVQP